MSEAERNALVREHFRWLGRSILERGLLWYASAERVKRLIHVEGDVALAERSERPVMWLVPHFMALDVAGAATQLFQQQQVASIYQEQSDAVMDAAIRRGRLRFKQGEVFPRSDSAKPLIRAIRQGWAFFNLPDMDFGERDAAFVPFFGVPAATLLAPSRMARALDMAGAARGRRDAARRARLPRALSAAVDALSERRRARRHRRDEPLDRRRDPPQPGAVPVGAQALQDEARWRSVALLMPAIIRA